jgi:DNA-binding NtrC family response regulator
MHNPQILIARENEVPREDLRDQLARHEFSVTLLPTHTHALSFLHCKNPDLIIIGSKGQHPFEGLQLAKEIRAFDQKVPLILITERSSEDCAVAALRSGVNDYFKVPFSFPDLLTSIRSRVVNSEIRFSGMQDGQKMIGESRPMQEISLFLARVAGTDSTVLITGETGTGKELAATLVHEQSARKHKPLVCINCAAMPEGLIESEMFGYERGAFTGAFSASQGKFEMANGGTVFLDEIGDMSPFAQAKLLRAIESKEIQRVGGKKVVPLNVRVAAATNQDPEQLVAEGKFREDLYYRLNVARIHMPPLRERKEDIPVLVEGAVTRLNRRFGREVEGLTREAMTCLLDYDWPGNVRELLNLLEAAFINLPSHRITLMDLPQPFRRRLEEVRELPEKERDRVLSALFATNWNKSKAAEKLQWSRMTLYRKMVKYNISDYRTPGDGDKV